MNVGIDWKRWNTKCLCHHHLGRFMSDARQRFQCIKICGDNSSMFADKNLAQADDGFCLLWPQSAGANDGFNRANGSFG